MREIRLTQGAVALVDDEDFDRINAHKWCLGSAGYATRNEWDGERNRGVLMHREILGVARGEYVDHVNMVRLDNQRGNLRRCGMSQNMANSGRRANKKSSAFKGAYRTVNPGRWRASIKVNGREMHLGCFGSDVEAARAYDAAAVKHFGAFAKLNFPRGAA